MVVGKIAAALRAVALDAIDDVGHHVADLRIASRILVYHGELAQRVVAFVTAQTRAVEERRR